MDWLKECAKDILSVRGLCTLALTGAVIGSSVTGTEVPEVLKTASLLALGYFFGRNGYKASTQKA